MDGEDQPEKKQLGDGDFIQKIYPPPGCGEHTDFCKEKQAAMA